MPVRNSLLIYTLPLLAVWVALLTRHPAGSPTTSSRSNSASATTTCRFQLLNERNEPMEGAVVETHGRVAHYEVASTRETAGRASGAKRDQAHVMIVDTIDLGSNSRRVSGCQFHIGVGDRPLHRVVTLLASDDGRHFAPIAYYRANGTRSVFGVHRYWRLQYPFTGNRASRRRSIPARIE